MNISFGEEGCYSEENNVAILNFVMMRFLFLMMPYFLIFMMRRNASTGKFKVVYSTKRWMGWHLLASYRDGFSSAEMPPHPSLDSTTSSFRKSRSLVTYKASHSFFVPRHFSELTTCSDDD